jgi:hypothetical protein
MIDEANTPGRHAEAPSGSTTETGTRVGYCQECGQSLTRDALRRVGSGIFCEPCAELRNMGRGWQPINPKGYVGGIPTGAVPPPASEPNPVLAGILGFIPGVGAMFNGQYAKGALHLIVFVIVLSMAENLNWVFYWFVWGWIFYQVFDAYHTARARRDSQPLPNPFGWNDIGERFGFHRNTPPASDFGPPPPPVSNSRRAGASWAGYVPPSRPSAETASPFSESQNPYNAPYTPPQASTVQPPPASVPYVPTFTGGPALGAAPSTVIPTRVTNARRFPFGALWLIGLGMVFLTGNLLPGFRLTGRWLVPALLAALSLWSALRRWESWRNTSCSLVAALVVPVMLLTVSGLLALQAARLLTLHRSWPVLLVVWGAMLLLQRSATAVQPTDVHAEMPIAPPPPVRTTSGTGTYGL